MKCRILHIVRTPQCVDNMLSMLVVKRRGKTVLEKAVPAGLQDDSDQKSLGQRTGTFIASADGFLVLSCIFPYFLAPPQDVD